MASARPIPRRIRRHEQRMSNTSSRISAINLTCGIADKRYNLQERSTDEERYPFLLEGVPKKIFYQVLNHKSPLGFDSFVGEIIREIDGMLEVKYRFCSSGHGKYFRNFFTPDMFHYICEVNDEVYKCLQLPEAYIPGTYQIDEHRASRNLSKEEIVAYLRKCELGNFVYLELQNTNLARGHGHGVGILTGKTIPSKDPITEGHIEVAILTKKKDTIKSFSMDFEKITTDLVRICEVKHILRLTRKQARAVADAHYDCCMQLSWSDIDEGVLDSDDLSTTDDESSDEQFE